MSLQDEIDRLNEKIKEVNEKFRQAHKNGASQARKQTLKAELDNLCEERDFYQKKLREKEGNND